MTTVRRWLRGDFARHVYSLGSGTALGQLIVVAVTPLLTRLYTPDDLGRFGLLSSFLAFATVATTLRLDFAVATTANRETSVRLLAVCLIVCPVVSLALGGALGLLIRFDVFAYGLLPYWTVPLSVVALIATGIFVALRYWHVGRRGFAAVSRALVTQGAGRATGSLALGLAGSGWAGLAAGEVLGRLLGIRGLWRDAGDELRRLKREGRLKGLGQEFWRARRYPMVVLPSSLVDSLAAALPLPVIAWLFGPAAAGQFALVWRVAALPGGLIGASVGDVFHAHATGARDVGPEQVRRLLLDTLRMLVLVALLIYVPVCLVAPWVFPWVFGEPWGAAGQMMLYLAPMWIASMVVSPVSRLPVVLGRPGLKFVFDLCFLVLPSVALFLARKQGLMVAILAFGAATAVAYGVFLFVLYATAHRPATHAHP